MQKCLKWWGGHKLPFCSRTTERPTSCRVLLLLVSLLVSAVNSYGCQPATASPGNEAVDDLTIGLRNEDDLDW